MTWNRCVPILKLLGSGGKEEHSMWQPRVRTVALYMLKTVHAHRLVTPRFCPEFSTQKTTSARSNTTTTTTTATATTKHLCYLFLESLSHYISSTQPHNCRIVFVNGNFHLNLPSLLTPMLPSLTMTLQVLPLSFSPPKGKVTQDCGERDGLNSTAHLQQKEK